MEDLLKLQYQLWQEGVEPALEMSKRGGHLWILLATPLLAKECRVYIHDSRAKAWTAVEGFGIAGGLRFFPGIMQLVRESLATPFVVRLGSTAELTGDFSSTVPTIRWKLKWST